MHCCTQMVFALVKLSVDHRQQLLLTLSACAKSYVVCVCVYHLQDLGRQHHFDTQNKHQCQANYVSFILKTDFLCNSVLSLRKSEPPALYYTGTVRTVLSSRLARVHCTGPRDVKLLWLLQRLFSLWVRSLV